jgi:hypothetical protein
MDNPGPPVCGGEDGVCAWNPVCHVAGCVNYLVTPDPASSLSAAVERAATGETK